MSNYSREKPAVEPSAQPPPTHHGFGLSAGATPAQHGSYDYGQPQQLAYLQAPAFTQVVTISGELPPNNHLTWSIISLIFLCLPLGIAALVFSVGVNDDYAAGLHVEARRKSYIARVLNIVATALGATAWIIFGVLLMCTYVFVYRVF